MAGYPQALKNVAWAVELERRDAAALGRLRQHADWQMSVEEETVWLAGPLLSRELAGELDRLPCRARWQVDAQKRLLVRGGRVPRGVLPEAGWSSLPDGLEPSLPRAALPAQPGPRLPVRLIRSEAGHEPMALLTDLDRWQAFAEEAPRVRLERWRFAVAADSRVLIVGNPLPPLPGESFWLLEQALLPLGYELEYAAAGSVLSMLLFLGRDDLALFQADSSWEQIAGDNLIAASRDAIRLSGGEPGYA